MTCPCGNLQCYICSQNVTGYDHFGEGKCPQYDNTKKRHQREVAAAQKRAVQNILERRGDVKEDDIMVDKDLMAHAKRKEERRGGIVNARIDELVPLQGEDLQRELEIWQQIARDQEEERVVLWMEQMRQDREQVEAARRELEQAERRERERLEVERRERERLEAEQREREQEERREMERLDAARRLEEQQNEIEREKQAWKETLLQWNEQWQQKINRRKERERIEILRQWNEQQENIKRREEMKRQETLRRWNEHKENIRRREEQERNEIFRQWNKQQMSVG